MEQNPWDANTSSGSQEIPCILLNLNVHYRIHKSPLAILDPHELSSYPRIYFFRFHLTFRRRIKSRLPFAGIIRRSPYSTRFQDKG